MIAALLVSSAVAGENRIRPYRSKEDWQQVAPKRYQRRAEYAFVEADPALPNVLLIGDSISMGYTLGVRRALAGIANVYRAPDNCRSTRQTLAEIETYLGEVKWNVIHFNWGIHDLTHLNAAGKTAPPPDGKHQVGLEAYRANVEKLVARLKQADAKLVWAATTPIGNKYDAGGIRRDRDVVAYNAAATGVMKAEGVRINDLYALAKPNAEAWLGDGVHFKPAGNHQLAHAVADAIRAELAWFREDFTETPPEIPVQQKHLANPDLILKRLGPGEGKIKRSFHKNKPGDPHYVWSGLCPGRWALAFEDQRAPADLSKFGRVRWRTKQGADRVLRVILRTRDGGWLVSDRGTPKSEDWLVDQIDLTKCQWFRLDIETIAKGERVENPDLSEIREIGFSDLEPGGQSKACSRLDWIEVYGRESK